MAAQKRDGIRSSIAVDLDAKHVLAFTVDSVGFIRGFEEIGLSIAGIASGGSSVTISRSRSGANSAAGGSVGGGSDSVAGVGIASVGSGVGVLTGAGTAVGISVRTEVAVGGFSDSCPQAIRKSAEVAMPSETGNTRMLLVGGFTLIRAPRAFAVRQVCSEFFDCCDYDTHYRSSKD